MPSAIAPPLMAGGVLTTQVGVIIVPTFASWLHSPAGRLPQTPASVVADESGISFASAPASSEPAGQMQMHEGCSLSYGGAPTQGCPLDVYPASISISHGLPMVQGGFRSSRPPHAAATSKMHAMNVAALTRTGERIRPCGVLRPPVGQCPGRLSR